MNKTLFLIIAGIIAGSAFAQNVDLPAPQKSGGMPLMDALAKRATARAFDPARELSQQQLSDLLWASWGVNRPDGRRTAPSASNHQEADVYVLLKSGTFIYNAPSNRLDLVSTNDERAAGGSQAFVKDAPVTLVFVADLSKMGKGSDDGKLRTANIDVGYISQNTYLYCASEGLATGVRGSVDRATLAPKLNLRTNQVIIVAQSVGYTKP